MTGGFHKMENTDESKKIKKDNSGIMILISALVFVIFLMVGLYEMINDSKNVMTLGIIGVGELIATYFIASGLLHSKERQHRELREDYDNIYKSEKASYLIVRKSFNDLDERLNILEKKTSYF